MNPYENLANAIVVAAARDYRHALKILKRFPRTESAKETKDECERFFRSDYYRVLTNIDGEMLIHKLIDEVMV